MKFADFACECGTARDGWDCTSRGCYQNALAAYDDQRLQLHLNRHDTGWPPRPGETGMELTEAATGRSQYKHGGNT